MAQRKSKRSEERSGARRESERKSNWRPSTELVDEIANDDSIAGEMLRQQLWTHSLASLVACVAIALTAALAAAALLIELYDADWTHFIRSIPWAFWLPVLVGMPTVYALARRPMFSIQNRMMVAVRAHFKRLFAEARGALLVVDFETQNQAEIQAQDALHRSSEFGERIDHRCRDMKDMIWQAFAVILGALLGLGLAIYLGLSVIVSLAAVLVLLMAAAEAAHCIEQFGWLKKVLEQPPVTLEEMKQAITERNRRRNEIMQGMLEEILRLRNKNGGGPSEPPRSS